MTPVTMKRMKFGYFPKVFVVDGVEHTVQDVVRCWTDVKRSRLGFQVRCKTGTFNLFRNVKTDNWTIGAQWTP